jgi:TolA-binding protein
MSEQLAIEYYNKGLKHTNAGELDKALELLKKAIAEDPKHINSYNTLGSVYRQQGDLDAARKTWRAALGIDPDNTTARQCLEAAKKPTQIQVRMLLWVAAVVVLVLAALIITNVVSLRRISELEAELKLAKVVTLDSQNSEISTQNRVEQQDEKVQPTSPSKEDVVQQPPVAKPPVQITRSILPTASMQITQVYEQALSDCKAGWYDQAMEGFRKVLEHSSPHDLKDNAQYWLAECYYAQKEYEKALNEFMKVKQNFPAGNKVFDAELKIAYVFYKLYGMELAKKKVAQISKDWPQQQYRSQIQALSEQLNSDQSE